jgi:rubrerythrin
MMRLSAAMARVHAAGRRPQMHPETREHLMTAMRDAAFTLARYRLCAVQARHHGREQLADLFDDTASEAYFDHFAREALLAGLIGTEAENLHDLIRHEASKSDKLYRVFAEQADAVGDIEAARCFRKVGEQERQRRERLLAAMRALDPADPAE